MANACFYIGALCGGGIDVRRVGTLCKIAG